MGLEIKDPQAHELAQALSDLTGDSIDTEVLTALRERFDRMKRKGVAERLMEIGRQAASHMSEEERSFDYDAFLYDENGLPK